MKTRHPGTEGRRGFTLIELRIVIAIIGLLVSMISAAAVFILTRGKQTQLRVEISQISVAMEQFKQRFGVYPPSRLKLCENFNSYGSTQFDLDSVAFITKMFPNIDINIWKVGIDWNG